VRIAVITGTTREERFSTTVTQWVLGFLAEQAPDLEVVAVDLRDHPLPFFYGPNPARAPREYPEPAVAELGRVVDDADGFLVLTGEYNHGYPAVLKNALDWYFEEWNRKPVARLLEALDAERHAVEQLREVVVELEMAPVRQAVHILPDVFMPARSAEPGDLSAFAPLEAKLKLTVDDLLWWAATLHLARLRSAE